MSMPSLPAGAAVQRSSRTGAAVYVPIAELSVRAPRAKGSAEQSRAFEGVRSLGGEERTNYPIDSSLSKICGEASV